jgi:pimeloyl-ACP methyl ester carboxylesterase
VPVNQATPPPSAVTVRLCRPARTEPAHRILLLHGLGGGAATWEALPDHARDDLEIWSAELPWRFGGPAYWAWHPRPHRWIAAALGLGGHFPMVERPDAFAAALHRFIDHLAPVPTLQEP